VEYRHVPVGGRDGFITSKTLIESGYPRKSLFRS
jgi:hypothetical protein